MILLVVDTQKGITDDRLFAFEKIRQNIMTLIEKARKNDKEVIFVQHDDGPGSGFSVGDEEYEIYEDFAPERGEKIFTKTVNSSFHPSTGLAEYLKEKNEKQVMIVGFATNFCIDATIKSGFEHGFEMLVPEYTNSTFDCEYMDKETCYHYHNDFMWPKRYATCITMEEALVLLEK